MSGHNKWSKIKHQKATTDAKKSQLFSKLVKLISIEAKKSKGNLDSPSLKNAITKAKEANMPQDNIDRAVKKAAEAKELESVTYEAYGPGGVGLVIEALTGNRNKTAAEIKHLLSENSANLTAPGGVSWAFEKSATGWQAKTTIDLSDEDLEKLSRLADELENHEDVQEVITNAC